MISVPVEAEYSTDMLPSEIMGELDAQSRAGDRRFARYAWCVLAYNLLVILWGTVVRATGSGAGCGEHWPLCQGVVIPHAAQLATLIEFAHRISSGLAVVLVVLLLAFAFRQFASGHPARRYASASLIFTLTEGLIGAALVLFGQVGSNASLTRAGVLSLHLINTFLLLASIALTARAADAPHAAAQPLRELEPVAAKAGGMNVMVYLWYGAGLLAVLATALTGTIAALSDTLFPADSLAQGFQLDFSASANPLLRLRIAHPLIAVVAGGYLILLGVRAISSPACAAARRLAYGLVSLVTFQFLLGVLNLALLAPLGMQLLHLLTADLVWITLVLISAEALGAWQPAPSPSRQELWSPQPKPQPHGSPLRLP
jgi:heme a synthase